MGREQRSSRAEQRNPVYLYVAGAIVIVIILIILVRSCTRPNAEEQAAMTSTAQATEALFQTKVAAITAVVATQTQAAAPTATPLPQYICVSRGHYLGLAVVLEPFDIGYEEGKTYESCDLDRSGDVDRCVTRTPLEEGEFGPIIPDENIWLVIPGVDETICDDGDGNWVLDVSPSVAPSGAPSEEPSEEPTSEP